MKRFFLGMLFLAGLFLATSCTTDEEDSATLVLSETEFTLSSDSSEEDVLVTTNKDNWAVMSSDWISTEKNGTSLTLLVEKNTSVDARKGKVVVIAGDANATIEVEQAGAKGNAVIGQEVLTINSHEGTHIVDVNANSKDWKVSTDVDWLTAEPKAFKGELVIKVEENKERVDRVAKITLNIAGSNKEIVVKQQGVLYFIMPYTKIGSEIDAIKKFEAKRGSRLYEQPDEKNPYFWGFFTESVLFNKVRYGIDGGKYVLAYAYFNKDLFDAERANFIEYLKKYGFVQENKSSFYSEDLELKAVMETTKIVYSYSPRQDKAYPTFTKFPYGYRGWGLGRKNIDAYEKAHYGTFNEDASDSKPEVGYDYLVYDVNSTDKNDPNSRSYFVFTKKTEKYDKGLVQSAQYFEDMSLASFKGKDGLYHLTKEFKELCKNEGFVYVGQNDRGFHQFENEKKSLLMLMAMVHYQDEPKPLVDIRLSPLRKKAAAKNAYYVFSDNLPKERVYEY